MDKVILHIGDTVTHVTWGEGTVTDADEEFCTIKFAEKELTFRLPDAFENGFLTSDDAEIIDEDDWDDEEEEEEDDDEEEEDEVIEPAVTPEPKENKAGCLGIGLAFVLPLVFVGPFVVLFFILYFNDCGSLFLGLAIFGILLMIVLVPLIINEWKKPADINKVSPMSGPGTGLSPSSIFTALMIGNYLGGHARKNHKSIFDSAHDSLFWQEKYHKDRYYDDEEW